jgi:hypothetical protein
MPTPASTPASLRSPRSPRSPSSARTTRVAPGALAALAALLGATPVACGPRHALSHVRAAHPPVAAATSPTDGEETAVTSDPRAPEAAASIPGDASLDRARDLCVSEINRYRAAIGVAPVRRWRATEACTDDEARRDGVSKKAHGAFGSCEEWEQCECPGWDGPAETLVVGCLKAMWDEGPGGGHHDAMANPQNRFVSCGFHDAADGSLWAIQNYTGGR